MLPRHGLVVPTLTQLIFSVHTCHTTQGDRAADHLLCHRITPTVTAATDSAPRHVLEVHTAYVAQTRARCAYLDPADLALYLSAQQAAYPPLPAAQTQCPPARLQKTDSSHNSQLASGHGARKGSTCWRSTAMDAVQHILFTDGHRSRVTAHRDKLKTRTM
jgi:hypothetical protein